MAPKPVFPLPKGYFGDPSLTDEDKDYFRGVAKSQVQAALADERDFVLKRKSQVDLKVWKLVTQKHHLQVYRRRVRPLTINGQEPSMMSVGKLVGSLEDLIYGSYDKTHEEIKITISYMDVSAKDCTVLSTIDTATPEDPFHYLGIKWLLSKFPIVRQRDWCYLDALGINLDANGDRYGYFLLHSVNLPNCPAFDRKIAIRGQLYFTFIFRESSHGMIDVFSRGSFDPAGELIHQFSTIATAGVLTDIVGSVGCAESKKLTLLAFSNQRMPNTSVGQQCSVCTKISSMFVSMRVCRVCHRTVCTKCCSKKSLFAGLNYALCQVSCCTNCIVQAKGMKVRPAEESFSLLNRFVRASSTASERSYEGMSSTTFSQYENESISIQDTLHSSLLGVHESRMSIDSGISEEDVEQIMARIMSEQRARAASRVPSVRKIEATGSSLPTTPHDHVRSNSHAPASKEQDDLFVRLVELQRAAKQAQSTMLANQQLMDQNPQS